LNEQTRPVVELLGSQMPGALAEGTPAAADELPPLSEEGFDEAVATIREFCASFDDTSVQMVMDMLETYAVPAKRAERYARLRDAVRCADWEQIAAIAAET